MRNSKKIIVLAMLVIATSFAAGLSMQEASDADLTFSDVSQGKITPDGGNIYVMLENQDNSEKNLTLTVTYVKDGTEITAGSKNITVPSKAMNYKATVYVNLGGVGEYNIKITATDIYFHDGANTTTFTATVTESIWSGWTPYAALGIVALLVVIAAFIHIRSKPRIKPDQSFTQIEQERRSGKSAGTPGTSAERRRYSADKTGQPKAVVKEPEPKAASFTELEKEKAVAKKEAGKSEKKPGKEPGELKYVSSRRK